MTDSVKLLKDAGLKITPQRLFVLKVLQESKRYLCPEDIWGFMKKRFKNVGLSTVYRNLDEFYKKGIISKIMLQGRQFYYFFCKTHVHHHHFICKSCKLVEEIPICNFLEKKEEIERYLRGKVTSHFIQIEGLCENCLT